MKFSLLFLIVFIFGDIGCLNPNNVEPAARAAGSRLRNFDVVRLRNQGQLLVPIRDAAALRPDKVYRNLRSFELVPQDEPIVAIDNVTEPDTASNSTASETGNNSILLKFSFL
jgi:hypothetical protein